MKTLNLLLFVFLTTVSFAQVPENAKDISPLLVGEVLPEATLSKPDGTKINLQQVLKEKPTILVFYRGGWCPYCNSQLSGLTEIESQIINLGYQIVAISPDNFQVLLGTEEKNEIQYQLFSDEGAQLIQAVGIGFKTPEGSKKYIFNKTNFEATEILPVPTVMIVNKKGQILFEYINPDYKTRISADLLFAAAQALKKEL